MQLTTSKWKGCILFSLLLQQHRSKVPVNTFILQFQPHGHRPRHRHGHRHRHGIDLLCMSNIHCLTFDFPGLNSGYFLIKLSIWRSSTSLSMSLASLTPLSLSSKSSPLQRHPSLNLHHSLPPLPLDHPL